jgi:Phytanoyl-CoA dioxygenase (PhyH)
MNIKQKVQRDGFVVVPDLLKCNEIDALRYACSDFLRHQWRETNMGKFWGHAAGSVRGIEWIFTHPGILAAFREILDSDDVVFTGNSDIQLSRLSGWHKDNGNGQYYQEDCYLSEDHQIYRAGIYFQDHVDNARGLMVLPGSHRSPQLMTDHDPVYVPTRLGDVVFIDVRLSHIGQIPDLIERSIWQVSSSLNSPSLGRHLRNLYWQLIGRQNKMSLFFAYGAPNRFTDQFIQATMKCHCLPQDNDLIAHWPEVLKCALKANGVCFPEIR